MEARKKRLAKKDFFELWLSYINWNWLFSKGQSIFAIIFLLGMIGFILWFIQ